MGVTSQLLSTFSRKPIFGYKAMVYAILSIGFLGFLVWGHHMFMSGMNPYSAMAFSMLTMCIGVPSAIKTFNWIGTLWDGKIHFDYRHAVRARLRSACSSPAASAASSSASRRSTCTSTTPTSWSATST